MNTFSNDELDANEFNFFILPGIVISDKDEHPLKASLPIELTPSCRVILLSAEQLLNAREPIEPDTAICVNAAQSLKA